MSVQREASGLPPDVPATAALQDWRIDYKNLDERRRERHRREAAGASRDLPERRHL